ncbi:MAG: ankyrin repeat domain-containing protein [Candidatus Promineifilaceae bacterium]|nr:ankyrin repeat domain-containing protein [Candidatus Promineifilaceae bacterium]
MRVEVTTLLLEAGADPNLQNDIGNTALHQAAKWARTETIPILVEHGASLDIENMRGETPIDVATGDRTMDMLLTLRAGQ